MGVGGGYEKIYEEAEGKRVREKRGERREWASDVTTAANTS